MEKIDKEIEYLKIGIDKTSEPRKRAWEWIQKRYWIIRIIKMTGFLASENIDEAKKICSSNADIIDFKKVNDGALGFVGSNIIRQGRKVIKDRIISVTMGNEHNPNNNKTISNINYVIKNKIKYLKIGLFDIRMIHEHKKLIKNINFLETKPICVVFADQEFDLLLIQKIIDIGYKGVMIDTCNKIKSLPWTY